MDVNYKILVSICIATIIVALFLLKHDIDVDSSQVQSSNQHFSLLPPPNKTRVDVYYYVTPDYDAGVVDGSFHCSVHCNWRKFHHPTGFHQSIKESAASYHNDTINIAFYNHEAWKRVYKGANSYLYVKPLCKVPIDYHVIELLEAIARTPSFLQSAKYFDATSSTQTTSQIQQLYPEAFLPEGSLLPVRPYSELLPAISVFVSNCFALTKRNEIYHLLKGYFRIDGFGNCFPTVFTEDLLPKDGDGKPLITLKEWNHLRDRGAPGAEENRFRKRRLLNYYMFNLAFENTLEPGYLTEKVFEPLLAGSIPIFLGDSNYLKQLLNYTINGYNLQDSVIYLDDFLYPKLDTLSSASVNHMKDSQQTTTSRMQELNELENINFPRLIDYLNSIIKDPKKFEKFWKWRKNFNSKKYREHHPLLKTLQCRTCEWGYAQYQRNLLHKSIGSKNSQKASNEKSCFEYPPSKGWF